SLRAQDLGVTKRGHRVDRAVGQPAAEAIGKGRSVWTTKTVWTTNAVLDHEIRQRVRKARKGHVARAEIFAAFAPFRAVRGPTGIRGPKAPRSDLRQPRRR